ncbi:MAG: pyridoxamine 5'-phosphate oxidase [Actinobacteria bacterium]|nr:pyridoxamine 5'-phosphate oxidase [Actinomycetota bacterium]
MASSAARTAVGLLGPGRPPTLPAGPSVLRIGPARSRPLCKAGTAAQTGRHGRSRHRHRGPRDARSGGLRRRLPVRRRRDHLGGATAALRGGRRRRRTGHALRGAERSGRRDDRVRAPRPVHRCARPAGQRVRLGGRPGAGRAPRRPGLPVRRRRRRRDRVRPVSPDLGHFRENYDRSELRRADLADDPVTQFGIWFDRWMEEPHYDAAACVIATASADGSPSARYVLCRQFDADGFVVYTNLESRKASDLRENPRAALVFGWLDQQRQVRIEGPASLLSAEESDAYWVTRPRGSQIGAWASGQSDVIADRSVLDRRAAEVTERFGADEEDGPIPRPDDWGGIRIGVDAAEFWQGRPDRLHDRFRYARDADDPSRWQIDRLAP